MILQMLISKTPWSLGSESGVLDSRVTHGHENMSMRRKDPRNLECPDGFYDLSAYSWYVFAIF
jgi:hypothetical protein